jgi:hypothetical protein
MPETQLIISVGGSALRADIGNLQPWRALLNNADAIAVSRNGKECVRVELDGLKRWIVFERNVSGSPFCALGYQETVGALRRGNVIVGGSNRKVLAWLHPGGRITIGSSPRI